ncbi:SIS domain-containing protein [Vibrio mimicus]
MSKAISDYLNIIHSKLQILESKQDELNTIANVCVEAILNKKNLFVFGASHAGIISEELTYRAGGLALFNPIFHASLMVNVTPITLTSELEKLPKLGEKIIRSSKLKEGDILLLNSVSGRNPVVIDAALTAKSIGATVIGLTSVETSQMVTSKHPSGQLLIDIADHIIDNLCDYGDASVVLDGLVQKAAPLSTVMGVTIVNSICLSISEKLLAKGIASPILASANIDGNETLNRAIFDEYADNIHYL